MRSPTQCTHCRPSFYTFGDKSETPGSTVFYGFSVHSCSPSTVAWILWEHRPPKSSSVCCSRTPFPPSSSAKTTEHVKQFWQQTRGLAVGCGVAFSGRDLMLCLFCGSLCRTVLYSIDKNTYPRVYFHL